MKFLSNISAGTSWGTTGGGLENDIKSGGSAAALFLFCDEGGGAIRKFDGLWECPGLGLDLLNWRSYLSEVESVSVIDEARVTEILQGINSCCQTLVSENYL